MLKSGSISVKACAMDSLRAQIVTSPNRLALAFRKCANFPGTERPSRSRLAALPPSRLEAEMLDRR